MVRGTVRVMVRDRVKIRFRDDDDDDDDEISLIAVRTGKNNKKAIKINMGRF
jgi:hypothetical protein